MILVAAGFFGFLLFLGKAPKELQQLLLTLLWGGMVLGTIGSFLAALAGKI